VHQLEDLGTEALLSVGAFDVGYQLGQVLAPDDLEHLIKSKVVIAALPRVEDFLHVD